MLIKMKERKPKFPNFHQCKSVVLQGTICRADLNTFGCEEACDGCPLITNGGSCLKLRGLGEGINFPSPKPNLPNGTEVSMFEPTEWELFV